MTHSMTYTRPYILKFISVFIIEDFNSDTTQVKKKLEIEFISPQYSYRFLHPSHMLGKFDEEKFIKTKIRQFAAKLRLHHTWIRRCLSKLDSIVLPLVE